MSKDYYKILGVDKSASQDEIKKAFRKVAHKYHPDKQGGDEAKFKEANEAYQVLSNAQKRQQYDQFGSAAFGQGGGPSGFGGFGGAQGAQFDFGDLGDIFGDFFGGGGSRRGGRSHAGADLQVGITVDFEEAVFGSEKEIALDKNDSCAVCSGNGVEPGSKFTTCGECKGAGQVARNVGFGINFASVCPTCQGQGQIPERKCKHCNGSGVEHKRKNIKVKIPAGIDNGQMIRLTGEGQAVGGGKSGDLYIKVSVRPSKKFERKGYDIISARNISISQAVLGAKIDIVTLDGDVAMTIPPGTQSGTVLRIKAKGVPTLHDKSRGDHLVKVTIDIPKKLNKKQRKFFEELSELE